MNTTNIMRAFLSAAIVSGFLIALVALFRQEIPTANEQLLSYMLGQLSGFVAAIVAFDYGTSRGSEAKTDILAERPSGQPDDPVNVTEPEL